MKEALLFIFIIVFFIFIVFLKKAKKTKKKPKLNYQSGEKLNNKPENNVTKKSFNLIDGDGRVTSSGIIAAQMKKQKNKEETLKRPMGWVKTKSYEDDVRDISIEKYLHTEEEEKEEIIVNLDINKKNNPVILVVDDSVTVLKFIANVLSKQNYELISKEDGVYALDYLKMTNRFPDLIITDLEMPRMDGVELINNIRAEKKFKNIPILIVSSNPEPHVNLLVENLVNGIIQKPFDKEGFIEQVRYLLNK